MILLPREKYGNVLPLLKKIPCNILFAEVVAFQNASGIILVDTEDRPSICLIVHKYGMSLLAGAPNALFCKELCSFLLGAQNTVRWILVYPDELKEIWYQYAPEKIFECGDVRRERKGICLVRTKRVMFDFVGGKHLVDDGKANIKNLDAEDFERIDGAEAPKKFWNTSRDFSAKGLGFILRQENAIASYCFSSFSFGNRIEIGIETNPKYRNRGFATLLAAHMTNYCMERNLQPLWSCRIENVNSVRLAQKIGFVPKSEHEYFIVSNPG